MNLTFNRVTISTTVITIYIRHFKNHAVQWSQLGNPIIFIASFNCFSFSVVMYCIIKKLSLESKDYEFQRGLTLTILMQGYTKLRRMKIETRVCSPCSRISNTKGGYGNLWKNRKVQLIFTIKLTKKLGYFRNIPSESHFDKWYKIIFWFAYRYFK